MMVKGIYTSDSISLTNQTYYGLRIDSQGRLMVVSPGASSSGETTAGGVYNTSAPTLTNGSGSPLQLDVSGNLKVVEQFKAGAEDNTNNVLAVAYRPLAVATYTTSLLTDYAATVTKNVKATAGVVYMIQCENANAGTRYIQIHNTATTPGAGAAPLLSFTVLGTSRVAVDLTNVGGVFCSTGIAYGFSTTLGTYTAGSAADENTLVLYK